MDARRSIVAAVSFLIVGTTLERAARAGADHGTEGRRAKVAAPREATVQFAQPQPQTPDPAPAGAAVTHFLVPDDVTIATGGTVNFIVNGGGHGIAIHEVSKKTTRADIAEDLCDGSTAEDPDPIADRRARSALCNGTVVTTVTINGVAVNITGTNNLDYQITDGKGRLVIDSGFNVAISTTPPIVLDNPRLDDPDHSPRLLATSGASPGDTANPTAIAANRAGAFLTGTADPATVGNRIQVLFPKAGRYLVICMNRAHALNDHEFGLVSVVGGGKD